MDFYQAPPAATVAVLPMSSCNFFGDWRQLHGSEGTLLALRCRQQRRDRHVYEQHRDGVRTDPTRTHHVAVVQTPEYLQPVIHTLHTRPPLVQTLELRRRSWDRRDATQVDLLRHTYRLPMRLPRVALRDTHTAQALDHRWATILQRAAALLVTSVTHRPTHRNLAHRVVAVPLRRRGFRQIKPRAKRVSVPTL